MAYRYYFRSPGCKHFWQLCTSSNTQLPKEGSLFLQGRLLLSHAPA